MKRESPGILWIVGFVAVLAVAVHLAGCAESTRQKTINTALTAIDTECTSFAAYDIAHQKQILAASPDRATFDAALAAWKVKRDKVKALCKAAYDADRAAAELDNEQSLASLMAAGRDLYNALEEVRKL